MEDKYMEIAKELLPEKEDIEDCSCSACNEGLGGCSSKAVNEIIDICQPILAKVIAERDKWKNCFEDMLKNNAHMTTQLGTLPINSDGMRALNDYCVKLRKELEEFSELKKFTNKNNCKCTATRVYRCSSCGGYLNS